jgi:hypothetical protein
MAASNATRMRMFYERFPQHAALIRRLTSF